MNLHMIAPFHTVPSLAASHCAFTGKALRFARMMNGFFDRYYEYSNEGSESEAPHKVTMLTSAEMKEFYPRKSTDFWGNHAKTGTPAWIEFDTRLRQALAGRVRPGDFIAHPFGRAHIGIVASFPGAIHVETGIGYPDAPFGAYRVYESWAWAHAHWGRWGVAGLGGECKEGGVGLRLNASWVIPNYFEVREWPIGKGTPKGELPYVLYMGRIDDVKGLPTLAMIIKAFSKKHGFEKLRFVIAGQGDWSVWSVILRAQIEAGMVEYLGPISGLERADHAGRAVATIMPTNFVEPFGGSGVEGMLCGTPLLANAWGAFTETIRPGDNGYQCRTVGDYVHALENVLESKLSPRKKIAVDARARYSLEACRVKYERVFRSLKQAHEGKGAISVDSSTLWET